MAKLAVFVFLLVGVLGIIPADCVRQLEKQPNHAILVVFGDSLFDPGNNNFINTTTQFQANFSPYGETFFGNPTGRFCNGRIIPDFIAEFAKMPLIPPFLEPGQHNQVAYGFNFASAGAGALAETNAGLVISLDQQLKKFKKATKQLKVKRQVVGNAVYLFSIGSNDYLSPSPLFNPNSSQQYIEMVVGNITCAFEEIYKKGGRKVAIMKLGPLGCLPAVRAESLGEGGNGSCVPQVNTLAESHNALLFTKLDQLQNRLKGFKYSYFDSFSAALEARANPSKFGFKEVDTACCGTGPLNGVFSCGGKRQVQEFELCNVPQDHLFWDSFHPTEMANQISADIMWAGPPILTGPNNLQTLFFS